MRTNLNVPYSEKDDAKRLGAKWDAKAKTWYCPDGVDLKNFTKWLSDDLIQWFDKEDTRGRNERERRSLGWSWNPQVELHCGNELRIGQVDQVTGGIIIGSQIGALYVPQECGDVAPWE